MLTKSYDKKTEADAQSGAAAKPSRTPSVTDAQHRMRAETMSLASLREAVGLSKRNAKGEGTTERNELV